ncbi:MAG TPA: hypothetical protein VM051_01245 [Usitatibacter sp.]|nr:hypothetical protein [Usitatibacter sp.]
MRKNALRVAIRIAVALIASWYGALLAFSLAFPQCSSGSFVDSAQTICRIGPTDYGAVYHEVVMFSMFGLAPMGFTLLVLCFVLETGLHRKTRPIEENNAFDR